jgi:hypothetical protein
VSKSENSVPPSKISMILDVCFKGSDRAILAQAMPSPICMFLEGPACGVPKKTNAQLVRSQLRSLYINLCWPYVASLIPLYFSLAHALTRACETNVS